MRAGHWGWRLALLVAVLGAPGLSAVTLNDQPTGEAASSGLPPWSVQLAQDLGAVVSDDPVRASRWSRLPVLSASALAVPADGVADSTGRLQDALDSLHNGGTLVLGPGDYVQSRCLYVRRPDVRIIGRDATLHANNPDHMCLMVEADGFELNGLRLTARTVSRGEGLEQARIVVLGRGARIVGNTVDGSSSAAIWLHGARDFVVSGNEVRNSLSDGIHSSDGTRSGRISDNVVRDTWDDGIAVVSYLKSEQCRDVAIVNNDVAGVRWGRGIAVVGSTRVLIRDNRVDAIVRAAGILVAQEWSYKTPGASAVVISGNWVSRVAAAPQSAAAAQTGHASIEVNSSDFLRGAYAVSQVVVVGNRIADSPVPGIRLRGQMCDISAGGNTFERIAASHLNSSGAVCVLDGRGCRAAGGRIVGPVLTTFCPSGAGPLPATPAGR